MIPPPPSIPPITPGENLITPRLLRTGNSLLIKLNQSRLKRLHLRKIPHLDAHIIKSHNRNLIPLAHDGNLLVALREMRKKNASRIHLSPHAERLRGGAMFLRNRIALELVVKGRLVDEQRGSLADADEVFRGTAVPRVGDLEAVGEVEDDGRGAAAVLDGDGLDGSDAGFGHALGREDVIEVGESVPGFGDHDGDYAMVSVLLDLAVFTKPHRHAIVGHDVESLLARQIVFVGFGGPCFDY